MSCRRPGCWSLLRVLLLTLLAFQPRFSCLLFSIMASLLAPPALLSPIAEALIWFFFACFFCLIHKKCTHLNFQSFSLVDIVWFSSLRLSDFFIIIWFQPFTSSFHLQYEIQWLHIGFRRFTTPDVCFIPHLAEEGLIYFYFLAAIFHFLYCIIFILFTLVYYANTLRFIY
jgi:hypothetical protein